jgi:hypothetical protein
MKVARPVRRGESGNLHTANSMAVVRRCEGWQGAGLLPYGVAAGSWKFNGVS